MTSATFESTNLTSTAFESAKNRMCIRFRKKFVICSYDLRFCVAILCVVVGRQSHRASLAKTKWVLKKENIRPPNDAWKGYLKTWDRWKSQSFQRQCQKWGLRRPIWTPSCKGPTVGKFPMISLQVLSKNVIKHAFNVFPLGCYC